MPEDGETPTLRIGETEPPSPDLRLQGAILFAEESDDWLF